VRCRPLFGKEIKEGRETIVECDVTRGEIRIVNPKTPEDLPKQFTFDNVYDARNSQLEIYEESALPIVRAAIEGYNGTIFCYGQTGTGKTHTMEGKDEPASERGIIPNAFETVFGDIDAVDSTNKNFLVRASFLEIYNENVRDLLGKDQSKTCDLKETPERGVYVKDLTTFVVKSVAEIRKVLEVGKKNRSVGATLMNADSSRSHSIFTVTVETSEVDPGGREEDAHIRVGKLNLVDLAGSERQSKTQATGDRLKEATKINLSLSALGNVISALVDGKSSHIPYRDSKLTRLLQDSLGGNTKTVMIANLGPADYNFDETMSTLRYANRAKNIKNKPKINEDPKDAMLREFQEEIARLKAQLGEGGGPGWDPDASYGSFDGDGGDDFVEKVVEIDPDEDQIAALKREVQEETAARMRAATTSEDLERIKRQAEETARAEMSKMLEDKNASVEERERVRQAMEEASMELELQLDAARRDREKKAEIERQLKEMESKLLHGVDDLEARNRALEEAAALGAAEVEDREKVKEEQLRRIAAMEEAALLKEESFASRKEEAADKTKKLKKMFSKYQSAKQDLEEHARTLARERDDMMDSINLLRRQLALKEALIASFVPPEVAAKTTDRAHWEEEVEQWVLERMSATADVAEDARRPVSVPGSKRPTSDHARVAAALGDLNPRFKSENILGLELDMPERTTWDLDGDPAAYEGVQAVLDIAFSADGGERLAPYAASRRRRDDDDEEVGASGVEASRRGAPPPERARLVRPGSARRTAR
jgi:hypothetical protein